MEYLIDGASLKIVSKSRGVFGLHHFHASGKRVWGIPLVLEHLSRHLFLDTLNSGSVSTVLVSGWILNSKPGIFAKL